MGGDGSLRGMDRDGRTRTWIVYLWVDGHIVVVAVAVAVGRLLLDGTECWVDSCARPKSG